MRRATTVADLDASVRWYTEKLGLKVVQRLPTRQRRQPHSILWSL